MEAENIKARGYYHGHSAKGNFDVELKLRFLEDEAYNALQFISSVGHQLKLIAKQDGLPDPIKLGMFNFYNLRVDRDANVYVSLRANQDFCFINNIAKLMKEESFTFVAKVIPNEYL